MEINNSFLNFPLGLLNSDTDGLNVSGQLGIIDVGGVKKLTNKQGQVGAIFTDCGNNYFKIDIVANITTTTFPASSNPIISLGIVDTATNTVKHGIGIYSNGATKTIENGVAVKEFESIMASSTAILKTGKVVLSLYGKNNKIWGAISGDVNYILGRELPLPSVSNYYVGVCFNGSQTTADTNNFGTNVYLDSIQIRNDWDCYTQDKKYMYLAPIFAGGTDPALIIVPSDHSLIGQKQRILMGSHGHSHDRPVIFDTFFYGYSTTALLDRGYASVYVDGRPRCHWGNLATCTQMDNARQFLVDNLNFEHKAYTYGASMGGLIALNYYHFFPDNCGAICADVPVANLKDFYFNSPGNEDISDAYGWAYTTKDIDNVNDPFYLNAYAHDPSNNAASYVNVPIRIETGNIDTVCPPSTQGGYFKDLVVAAGGTQIQYTVENKGHAGSISVDEMFALFETVPREVPLSYIDISPLVVNINSSQTQQFTATGNKEFTPYWSATGGTITSGGLFTPSPRGGNASVTCSSEGISNTVNFTVSDTSPPTFINPQWYFINGDLHFQSQIANIVTGDTITFQYSTDQLAWNDISTTLMGNKYRANFDENNKNGIYYGRLKVSNNGVEYYSDTVSIDMDSLAPKNPPAVTITPKLVAMLGAFKLGKVKLGQMFREKKKFKFRKHFNHGFNTGFNEGVE